MEGLASQRYYTTIDGVHRTEGSRGSGRGYHPFYSKSHS